MTRYEIEASEKSTMRAFAGSGPIHAHTWDDVLSPRAQKCTSCGMPRPKAENINEGEIGRIYWDQEWEKRGVQENIYPKTYELMLSQIKETDKVIDIGCGTGSFIREYRKKFPVVPPEKKRTIYGMDISPRAILKVGTEVLEFYGYPGQFPEDVPEALWRSFDVVTATEFLEHVTDDSKVVRHLSMLLKNQDSILMVSVPDNDLPPETEAEHQRSYTVETLDELLGRFFDNVHILKVQEGTVGGPGSHKLLAVCTQRTDLRFVKNPER